MKRDGFIFDYVDWTYSCYKTTSKRVVSYIIWPTLWKSTKTTINPKTEDKECYTLKVVWHHQDIFNNPRRISKTFVGKKFPAKFKDSEKSLKNIS